MPGNWTDPRAITQGTLVWGPTLYTPVNNPVPQGPNIKEKIYRGINAGDSTVRRLVGTLNDFGDTQLPSDGTNNSFNCIRYCYALYDIVNPSVVYAGFTTDSTGETDYPNSVTYHTTLYQTNLTTRICEFTKSGNTSQLVSSGDIFNESDRASVTISAGTGFYIVTHGSVPAAGLYYASDYKRNLSLVSIFEQGVDVADKVNAPATIVSGGILNFCQAVCLMGSVPAGRRAIALSSDSIGVGSGGYINPLAGSLGSSAGGGIGYMAGYCDGRFDYVHTGRAGASAFVDKTNYTKRIAFMASANITDVWLEQGINDLGSLNHSAVTTGTDLSTLNSAIRAGATSILRTWQSTITPWTSVSGGGNVSDVNQTVVATLADGKRQTLNTTIRSRGLISQDGYCEAALTVENALDSNWWVANYAGNDGLHPLQAGGAAIATQLIADSALNLSNLTPTNITISSASISDTTPQGTTVGTLTTLPDPWGTYTYTLLNSAGGMFQLSVATIQVGATALVAGTQTIQVKTTNTLGETFTKNLNITVSHVAAGIRQSGIFSIPFPTHIDETTTRQSGLPGTYVDET